MAKAVTLNPGDVVTWYVPGRDGDAAQYANLVVDEAGEELHMSFQPTPWSEQTVHGVPGLTVLELEAVLNDRAVFEGPGVFWKSWDETNNRPKAMPDEVATAIDHLQEVDQ